MKATRESKYADFEAEGAYIEYKRLKVRLHEMKAANTPITPDEFFEDLLDEKEKVYLWCERKIAEITRVATQIVVHVAPDLAAVTSSNIPRGSFGKLSSDTLRLYADAILYELLRFQECRNFNWDCIERLLQREQRYTVLPPSQKWRTLSDVYAFQRLPLDEPFYLLQRLYSYAREETTKDAAAGLETAARAGQEFDRRSVKYWVHDQDLPFVIGRVIQHLPLNVYHDAFCEIMSQKAASPRSPKGNGAASDPVPQYFLGSPINSVYYDNSNFLFYHRRLQRLEGSSVLRIRWYDSAIRPMPRVASMPRLSSVGSGLGSPSKQRRASSIERLSERATADCIPPDGTVFLELKVHHEAWSGEHSTKRRFPLRNAEVNSFIHGELSLNPAVEKLRGQGCTEPEIQTFKSLAGEVFAKFNAYDLHPVLRTTYSRCAFQQPNDFSIRVSIDTDVAMIAEDFGSGKHWRFLGEDDMTRVNFPYNIVEVKLQFLENERISPWIEELCTCRLMEPVPKFSKYAHGMASLFGHTSRVQLLPYWIHQVDNEIRAVTKLENYEWDHTAGLVANRFQRLADFVVFGSRTPQTQSVGASEAQFLNREGLFRVYNTLAKKQLKEDGMPYVDPPLHLRQTAYRKHGVYASLQRRALIVGGIPIGGGGVIPLQSEKRVRVPQKFDPKTIFTSERYFLKWVRHAVKTALIALASIRFGGSNRLPVSTQSEVFEWQDNFHIIVGVILMGLAQLMLAYALMVFHARSRRVYARTKVVFDDIRGPTWLTIVLILSIAFVGGNYLWVRFAPLITRNSAY